MTTETVTKLTGQALLSLFNEKHGRVPVRDLAIEAGYVNAKGFATITQFSMAMMEAQGAIFTPEDVGRALPTSTKVQDRGSIVLSSMVVDQLGAEPGRVYKISVDTDAKTITLAWTDEIGELTRRKRKAVTVVEGTTEGEAEASEGDAEESGEPEEEPDPADSLSVYKKLIGKASKAMLVSWTTEGEIASDVNWSVSVEQVKEQLIGFLPSLSESHAFIRKLNTINK
jgi:hypothetical protein